MKGDVTRRLYRTLAALRDSAGEIACKRHELAVALDTSPRQIQRSTRALLRDGAIELVRPAQDTGRYSPNVYRLVDLDRLPVDDSGEDAA